MSKERAYRIVGEVLYEPSMELAWSTSIHILLASFSNMGPPICKGNIICVLAQEENVGGHYSRLDRSLFSPLSMYPYLLLCDLAVLLRRVSSVYFPILLILVWPCDLLWSKES